MADELIAKYNAMGQDFKTQSEKLLQEILQGFEQTMDASRKNYLSLQEGYTKGYIDIVAQAKTANTDMLKNMARNYNDLKASINNLFVQLVKNTGEAFSQSMGKFTSQCEDVHIKFPQLNKAHYNDTLQFLNNHYKKMLEDFNKRYKDLTGELDNKYANLVNELKMPVIEPPLIIHPSMAKEPNPSSTSSSKPTAPTKKK